MNIIIIPAFFQTKSRPTVGSFFLDQAKALKKAGHQVMILYCDTYSVKCIAEWLHYEEEPESQIEGIPVYRSKCFCPAKHGMEGHRQAFARGVLALWKKYAAGQQTDIIHAHCCVWAGYAAMLLSQAAGIPYVLTEHATLFQLHKDKISKANNKVIAEVFQKAAKVICVSSAFGKLLETYTANTEIIGNVVDCDRFQTVPVQEKHTGTVRFLTVCYMGEQAQLYKKGIDILIQAWAKAAASYPQARLIIGGGGKAEKKAREWAEEAHVLDSITFLGALSREQVAEQMQLCDCFVLPSRYETFGVVYIEAFACGKPVIAAANGGPDDFVKAFNGLLVPPENKDALEKAIMQMIEKLTLPDCPYQPQQIAAFAKEHFSGEAVAAQLERIYERTISNCLNT